MRYLVALCALLFVVAAQITVKGKFGAQRDLPNKVIVLPPLDNLQLIADEDNSHGGYQFGFPMDLRVNSAEDGQWTVINRDGDQVWSITLKSSKALSLGVTFKKFKIPVGGELYLIGENDIYGAYTHINNPADGIFTTFPMQGKTLTIQYFHPSGLKAELPSFRIMKVTHGYRPLAFGSSGKCNNNVACDDGTWADQIRSVGMLLTAFGSRYCSGALINNANQDGTQYFLTASHCSVGTTDSILFNYQSPACTPNTDGQTNRVVGQLSRLANNANSDFTLILINEAIPASWNVYLSGYSAQNVPPKSMVGIHHPSGDVKKISYANKAGVADRWSALEPGYWHWRVTSWDDGTTEPGSSGSPLYDQNQRIIGQLHGGSASCTNVNGYDSYGAVWASWTNGLSRYLDPNNSGTTILNGTNLAALRH